MSAGLFEQDGMFSVRERPWHGLGAILDRYPQSIDEAIELAGLDWEVEQRPVLIPTADGLDVEEIPGYFANVRKDTGDALGIVTSRYQPVQNREAFSFLANVFGSEMAFETAGSLFNGRRVWVLMNLAETPWVEVGGDAVKTYAFINNSHDGKSAVMLACTPVRIVCRNTLTAAVRGAQRTYTIRHIGDPSSKIAEARNALDVTINYYEQFKQMGDKLALVNLSDDRAKGLTEKLLPVQEGMGDRAARNREEAREAVMHLFKEGTIVSDGNRTISTVGNSPGTAWSYYNAITEWSDWYRAEKREGGRFKRIVDDPDSFKARAWELSLAAAGLN